ncbi:enoyl-CoA hydratase [Ktedonobacter sp. SOSP1-52]|uniref:enoyl-CoA hydratase/isomerase family protein n=1 Tax=Ktedonobacter sp. SOSP1-52 TaxID=2778366 RepID=UPI0019167913|nr:enoyl-CoA hydratase-related protein [Ktedonobacter sp. SOSP1-52]GHO67186.1 enoyl-CoA hydratase [Ktedonobacter sp. SOSP1-52]
MRSDFQHLVTQTSEYISTITMNRPAVLNAFNERMLAELNEAVAEAAQDEDVRCVILKGAGRGFGSGQDLSEFSSADNSEEPLEVSKHLGKYHQLIRTLQEMAKPTIASVHGVAAGISCNIALACDLRIAADNARFIQAFARIGLVPDGGGGYFLPRLVGIGKALEMAMLADEVSGPEAERLGLVNKCVPAAELEQATLQVAQRLAHGPTCAYGLIKQLMYQGLDSDLASSLKLEGELQGRAITTEDHREAIHAFFEKRAPKYQGK